MAMEADSAHRGDQGGLTGTWQLLVVEDDVFIARLVERIAERNGARATLVGTLAEARRALSDPALTALLLDVSLPDGNGLELIAEIRSLRRGFPVVAMSAGMGDIASEAHRLGADAFVAKPFTPSDLWDTLRRVVEELAPPGS